MTTISPASSVRSMKAPVRKAGEFCRVKIDDASMESIILDVMDAEQKAKIKTIGYGIEMTVPLKELYPSQGKEARSKQDVTASEILGGIKWSLKDQCLAPYGPTREMKLSSMKPFRSPSFIYLPSRLKTYVFFSYLQSL